jgi:hypothetical protein
LCAATFLIEVADRLADALVGAAPPSRSPEPADAPAGRAAQA